MKIYKKVLTFSTVLEKKHNENVINYFEDTVPKYSTMKRHVLHILRNNPEIKENILNKYLQDKYLVTKRTANLHKLVQFQYQSSTEMRPNS